MSLGHALCVFEPFFLRVDVLVVVILAIVVVVFDSALGGNASATTIPSSLVSSLPMSQSLASKSSVCGGGSGDDCDTDLSFSLSLRAVDWDVSAGSVILIDGRGDDSVVVNVDE